MKLKKQLLSLVLAFSMIFSFVYAEDTKHIEQKTEITIDKNLLELKDLLDIINKFYYKDVDYKKLFLNLNKSAFSSLDQHTEYFDKKETKELVESLLGKSVGIGIRSNLKLEYPRIEEVFLDSPAKKAGIQENDLIIAINGKSTQNISEKDYLDLIKGKKGTSVELTISRIDKEPFNIIVKREEYKTRNVFLNTKNKYPVIRIDSFEGDFLNEFDEIIKNNANAVKNGIIIDLRDNTGGLVDETVDLLSRFLEQGQVVFTKYEKNNKKEVIKTKNTNIKYKMPVAVLVNSWSASASEIFAGSIQNYKRGILVGQKTYGKGTVQDFFTLEDDYTSIKITTAEYKLKDDIKVDEVGIMPDFLVNNKIKDKIDQLTPISKKDVKKGDKGGNVFALQERLALLGYNVKENGIFDSLTEKALNRYQKEARLEITGKFDEKTRGIIDFDINKKILTDDSSLKEAIKQLLIYKNRINF